MESKEEEVSSKRSALLADAEFLNHVLIPLRIVCLQIIEQAAAPAHHHEKPTAGCVVFDMRLEVLGQLSDPLAQDGNLDLRTAGIVVVSPVSGDDVRFLLSR